MNDIPLRILFIVDYRSEIARGWIRHLAGMGHDVHVVSSFPRTLEEGPEPFPVDVIDLGFSQLVRVRGRAAEHLATDGPTSLPSRIAASGAVRRIWHGTNASLAGLEARRHRSRLERIVRGFRPDLVHSMRIPYESVLATRLRVAVPVMVSTWGNDLTLWAARRRRMAAETRRTLTIADALHCDCRRDVALAEQYGFSSTRPRIVLPGGGGVDRKVFHPGEPDRHRLARELGIPVDRPLIVNPRGVREYVRNDSFIRAWPLVLRSQPDAVAACVGMRGDSALERLRASLDVSDSLHLLPSVKPSLLAELFRASHVSVSPSTNDGTPNTLLEAMASGCLPLAGHLDSVAEWIDDGINGIFCDVADPQSIADGILMGLSNDDLRTRAAAANTRLVTERADRDTVMASAVGFYRSVLGVR